MPNKLATPVQIVLPYVDLQDREGTFTELSKNRLIGEVKSCVLREGFSIEWIF